MAIYVVFHSVAHGGGQFENATVSKNTITVEANNPRDALRKAGFGFATRNVRGVIDDGDMVDTSRYGYAIASKQQEI